MVSLAFFRFFYGSIISSGETEPLKNHARRFLWMGSAGVFAAQEAPTTRGCWRSASENPQAFGGMFPKRIGLEPSLAASDPQALIVDLPLETAMFITKAREVGERGSGRHSAVGGWPKRSTLLDGVVFLGSDKISQVKNPHKDKTMPKAPAAKYTLRV